MCGVILFIRIRSNVVQKADLLGVEFPGSGVKKSGYRLDNINITARLIGAPAWVEKSDIESLFGRWGQVLTSKRGTSKLSLSLILRVFGGQGWCLGQ